jgi:hypothetical protein
MFKVITIERWKGHITVTEYHFDNVLHMYKFIHLCEQDGIKYKVVRVKNNNQQKGA